MRSGTKGSTRIRRTGTWRAYEQSPERRRIRHFHCFNDRDTTTPIILLSGTRLVASRKKEEKGNKGTTCAYLGSIYNRCTSTRSKPLVPVLHQLRVVYDCTLRYVLPRCKAPNVVHNLGVFGRPRLAPSRGTSGLVDPSGGTPPVNLPSIRSPRSLVGA